MMQFAAWDSLLLFICSVYIVTQYRILPIDGTPYWLFGVLFIILLGNVIFSLYGRERFKKSFDAIKIVLFGITLLIVVGGSTVSAIVDRQKGSPVYGVHDIILQQEAAMRFLLQGKNPYKETYFNTPMAAWHYAELGKDTVNPALYHFVMPPWYLIFPFSVYIFSVPLFGYFDGRMVSLLCLIGTMYFVIRLFKSRQLGLSAATLLALGPGIVEYFIEGRSDLFALFWFVWAISLLSRKAFIRSAIVFALALMSKQTIWFAFPFYLSYLWQLKKNSWKKILPELLVIFIVCGVLTGPFIFWNPRAFVESVILYLSGGTKGGYPVSGYGLGMVLYSFGIIKGIHDYYPFALWQLCLGLPIMIGSIIFMLKRLTISRLLIGYAVTLMVVWYVSRYFNNSHLSYVGSLFVLGVLKQWDEQLYESSNT